MLSPCLYLFTVALYDISGGGFQRDNVNDTKTSGFLHQLIDGLSVATGYIDLDVATQLQPVVICALAGAPLDIVVGLSVGDQCFLEWLSLLYSKRAVHLAAMVDSIFAPRCLATNQLSFFSTPSIVPGGGLWGSHLQPCRWKHSYGASIDTLLIHGWPFCF